MPITSQLVKDFYTAALPKFKAQTVDKSDSDFMRLIASFLDSIGVMDKDVFLHQYTTTIGAKIYTPYEIGVDGGAGGYGLWNQIKVLVHELVHVVQYHDAPAEFMLKYLLHRSDRASYEAAAYAADLEMAWWKDGKGYDVKQRAQQLLSYGLKQEHCDYVANYLMIHDDVFRQGGSTSEIAAWAKEWLTAHGAK